MFAYCENNPICNVDPSGTSCICYILANCPCDPAYDPVCTESQPCAIYLKRHPEARPKKTYKIDNIRICTDGSDGKLVPDNDWREDTAFYNHGYYLDAYQIPYIVLPYSGPDKNAARLGDKALLINHDTGLSVLCVVGERSGPDISIMGEVSIRAIWDTGNPEHMTANNNSGLSNNYEIVLYPGSNYFPLNYYPY